MNRTWNLIRIAATALSVAGAARSPSGFPWQNESLRYSINWQSGLSLGEATLGAHKSDKGWEFEATVNAGVPGSLSPTGFIRPPGRISARMS